MASSFPSDRISISTADFFISDLSFISPIPYFPGLHSPKAVKLTATCRKVNALPDGHACSEIEINSAVTEHYGVARAYVLGRFAELVLKAVYLEAPVAESEPDLHVILHECNQGKGAAVRTGLQHASGNVMLVQDADLEYDPRDYVALLQPIVEGRSQVVYGSRFRGGPTKAMFFWHMIGNRFLTLVTNVLYNTILSDMETCYKVFTREVADQLRLRAPRWGFDPEITVQILKRGYRIYEVPISYTGREFEEGKKISWRDGLTVLWTLVKYRFRR